MSCTSPPSLPATSTRPCGRPARISAFSNAGYRAIASTHLEKGLCGLGLGADPGVLALRCGARVLCGPRKGRFHRQGRAGKDQGRRGQMEAVYLYHRCAGTGHAARQRAHPSPGQGAGRDQPARGTGTRSARTSATGIFPPSSRTPTASRSNRSNKSTRPNGNPAGPSTTRSGPKCWEARRPSGAASEPQRRD